MSRDHSQRCNPLPDPRVLSRENTATLLGHLASSLSIECGVHPGIQGILPPAVSMAPSPPSFPRILCKAGAHSLASPPLAESRAIAMQMTLSLNCPDFLGSHFINISAILFCHSPPSSLQQSSLKEMHSSTAPQRRSKMPAKLSPQLVMSGRAEESSRRTWPEMGSETNN